MIIQRRGYTKEIIYDYTSPSERGFLNSSCFPLILAKRLIALLLQPEFPKKRLDFIGYSGEPIKVISCFHNLSQIISPVLMSVTMKDGHRHRHRTRHGH
jgi:hypothetical protein